MIVEEIQKTLQSERVPVWGLAQASKMMNEPPGYRPGDLLPGANSLISFGIPVPRGVYRMPIHTTEMIWRSQNLYYRRLDTLSVRIAALLEGSGERAVPVFGCMPLGINQKRDVVGYLNQIRMGETAGIGVIGKNGLLIHSHYGARLMLGGVITTAVLPAMHDPLLDEPGCPPDCRICVDACPAEAISFEKQRVKIMRCLGYTSRTPFMSKLKFAILRACRPESAARLINLKAFDEHILHVCSQCVALCPYGSEK